MRNLVKSLRLTLVFCVFFSICYILVLWIFGLIVGPGGGNAETLVLNGRVVGAANVGQQFTKDIYFWGRPSHAGGSRKSVRLPTASAKAMILVVIPPRERPMAWLCVPLLRPVRGGEP